MDKYCLNPSINCEYRNGRTGECIASKDCAYKAWVRAGLSRELEVLLCNMCAIQMQNAKILELLQKQK